LYSEEFDSVSWNSTGINRTGTPPFVDQEVAPNGTMTADKLIEDTSSGLHNLRSAFVVSTLVRHAFSFFAKKSEKDVVGIRTLGSGLFGEAIFNLNNGTVISVSGTGSPEAKIENFGNGWYRCILTAIPDQTTFSLRASLYGVNDTLTYTGDGTSGVFIWGAQIETGAVATTYIPTTTASATRNADVCSVSGVSGYIGQTEGTIYAEFRYLGTPIVRAGFVYLRYGAARGFSINYTPADIPSGIVFISRNNSGTTNIQLTNGLTLGAYYKIAIAYDAGGTAAGGTQASGVTAYVNGSPATVSVGSLRVPDANINEFRLYGANSGTDSEIPNGNLRAAAIYTTRLSNEQLESLTRLT